MTTKAGLIAPPSIDHDAPSQLHSCPWWCVSAFLNWKRIRENTSDLAATLPQAQRRGRVKCGDDAPPYAQLSFRVGLYFTPPNPGRVSVSRSITPDHAIITPFSGREHTRWHPLSIESNFSVIMWHPFRMGGDHFDLL